MAWCPGVSKFSFPEGEGVLTPVLLHTLLLYFWRDEKFRVHAKFKVHANFIFTWNFIYLSKLPKCQNFQKKSWAIFLVPKFGPVIILSIQRYITVQKQDKIPYKAIATSLPLLAVLLCFYSSNFIAILVQIYLPTFFKEVLYLPAVTVSLTFLDDTLSFIERILLRAPSNHKLRNKNGLGSCNWLAEKRSHLSNSRMQIFSRNLLVVRLLSWFFCYLASAFVGVFFVLIAIFADCQAPYLTLGLFCMATISFSPCLSGFYTSLLSLAPAYTGFLTSLAMLSGIIGQMTTPHVVYFFNRTVRLCLFI